MLQTLKFIPPYALRPDLAGKYGVDVASLAAARYDAPLRPDIDTCAVPSTRVPSAHQATASLCRGAADTINPVLATRTHGAHLSGAREESSLLTGSGCALWSRMQASAA